MKRIRQLLKNLLRRYFEADVSHLKDLLYVGSTYHGYHIPNNYLNTDSVCYCVGAGLDISFDIELVTRFGVRVFIFDPMPYALSHFKALVNKTRANKKLSINAGNVAYTYEINEQELSTITFVPIGLWDQKTLVKFYYPIRGSYAGHSITNIQGTSQYLEGQVDTLSNLMRELNHRKIDLLKIETEGAEYTIIDSILQDKPDIKIILVEFDKVHPRKGKTVITLRRIKSSSDRLCKSGYTLVHSISCYKRTFIRNDVYELLKKGR